MKRFFTLLTILAAGVPVFAQNPGQIGTLLPNSAPVNKNNRTMNSGSMTYMWNYNYVPGYAEVFIRIPETGVFTVTINNQSITTNTGRFRFFDLQPGASNFVTIMRSGVLVYRTNLNLQNNMRYIVDYFTMQGMYLLNTMPLNMPAGNGNYSDLWNQMWNGMYNPGGGMFNFGQNWNPFFGLDYGFGQNWNNQNPNWNNQNPNWNNQNPNWNNQNPNWNNQNPNWNNQNPGWNNNNPGWNNAQPMGSMDPATFAQFKSTVTRQSFDDSRINTIKQQTRSSWFTAAQIKEMCDLLSFENSKLDVAKYCYDYCVDRQNYFVIYPTFDFESSVKQLTDHIGTRR